MGPSEEGFLYGYGNGFGKSWTGQKGLLTVFPQDLQHYKPNPKQGTSKLTQN